MAIEHDVDVGEFGQRLVVAFADGDSCAVAFGAVEDGKVEAFTELLMLELDGGVAGLRQAAGNGRIEIGVLGNAFVHGDAGDTGLGGFLEALDDSVTGAVGNDAGIFAAGDGLLDLRELDGFVTAAGQMDTLDAVVGSGGHKGLGQIGHEGVVVMGLREEDLNLAGVFGIAVGSGGTVRGRGAVGSRGTVGGSFGVFRGAAGAQCQHHAQCQNESKNLFHFVFLSFCYIM